MKKSTVEEIRQRFDNEVHRFENLQTGQTATIDAPLALELVAEAAATTNPQAKRLLDIGCGAGNYTLKLLERLPNLDVTLVDLSKPMLDKADERIRRVSTGSKAICVKLNLARVRLTLPWLPRHCIICGPMKNGGRCSQNCTVRLPRADRCGFSI
jgi:ubiquinone/menaquinone biosynthesis C-methylase UbiE